MISKDNIYNLALLNKDMVNELISVRIPRALILDSERIVREGGFSTIQEFIKHSLREEIARKKREYALFELEQLRGSVKNVQYRSKKEIDEHIKKVFS